MSGPSTPTPSPPLGVSLAAALLVIDAARKRADRIGVPQNVAVVDAGGHLVAFARMDGAWLGSIAIAKNKAYTARAFDMSTKELAERSAPGGPAVGIADGTDRPVAIFPGGVPLFSGRTVVGAVGVSGGTPDQDHDVAEAGAAAFTPAG